MKTFLRWHFYETLSTHPRDLLLFHFFAKKLRVVTSIKEKLTQKSVTLMDKQVTVEKSNIVDTITACISYPSELIAWSTCLLNFLRALSLPTLVIYLPLTTTGTTTFHHLLPIIAHLTDGHHTTYINYTHTGATRA